VLLESPTRGLDVESGQKIWRYLRETFSGRGAIVFSSAELDEILAVANRVLVFFDGRVVRDLRADELDYEHIASAMTGK
jgi:ABC-type sugar transport system ATPase subunit